MNTPRRLTELTPSLPFALLLGLLAVLWIAGGASRADVLGQVVVRAAAWSVIIVSLLAAKNARAYPRAIWLILLACIALPLLQLIPLPPELWMSLPGRALLVETARVAGEPQPWRPLSMVPGATLNAAMSLVVPLAVLSLLRGMRDTELALMPSVLLGFVTACALIGLVQVSGTSLNNPLINDSGQVSGTFANRNHFALLLAFGCVLAPVWAFFEGRAPRWKGVTALGLATFFTLMILATGSRTGLLLAALALGSGLLIVRHSIRKTLATYPSWVFYCLIAGVFVLCGIVVLVSVAADRAMSIDRVLAIEPAQDVRRQALPTIINLIEVHFPVGSGLGAFDPIFRIYEPFKLLKLTYLNHAHNEYLEIALDAGLLGVLLLSAVLIWWLWASAQVWRDAPSARSSVPKLGSAILLLVFIASVFDYPARTPIIMASITIAAWWLSNRHPASTASALPKSA
jgi:O-antigen ligase